MRERGGRGKEEEEEEEERRAMEWRVEILGV